MYNCYMIPSYADGRIIYPLVRKNGHLTPPLSLDGTCQPFWLIGNVRTVIQAEKPGAEPESLEIQWQENKASPWRFCPLVPFVEGNKLSPRLVTDDDVPDTCISRAEYEDIKQ